MGYKSCIKLLEEIKEKGQGLSKELKNKIEKEIDNRENKQSGGYQK